ncbi:MULTISPECIES: glycosyltransferase family 4 protein [unclassified Vibrio]|uniref:glycosyltransferase family 4 protein n=1 Tax=unclassified Vibrio TaxID=2614977 RepID=UPI00352E97C5
MNLAFLLGDCTAKGGIEKVTMTLASALCKHTPTSIISLYKSNSESSFEANEVPITYLKPRNEKSMYNRTGKFGVFFDLIYVLLKASPLRKALRKNSSDVVISCDIKMTVIALLATMFTPRKVVVIEHFEYDVPSYLLKKIRKFIYRWVSGVVILTDEDRNKYSWFGNNKIHTIPNIVSVKHSLKSVNKDKTVIAVGRLCHQKGFDLLISAWKKVDNRSWNLHIYGEGEDEELLSNMIEEYYLNNVKLFPFTPNIDEKYQSSSIFVLSSRFEGLGMVLIEALAHKLPCISFDCPAGPKTIIKHGINGTLVPTGDIEKLANAISELMESEELRNEFSRNSIDSIKEFSEVSVVNKWNVMLGGIYGEH